MEKRCFKCGGIKPLSAFYKHPQMLDGHVNKCKECNKRDVRQNRADNIGYYRNYDRLRYDEHGVRGNPQPAEKQKQHKRDWYDRNKHKKYANTVVARAIKSGELLRQPCSVCGCDEDVEAHHEDYDKPLDVIWLCTRHHGLTRRKPRIAA